MVTRAERIARCRKGLSSLFLPLYDAVFAELSPEWAPYFGLRTFEEQDRLYAQGRTASGSIVTQARGGESAHNYGCAFDATIWTSNGAPIWIPRNDFKWVGFVELLTKFGLKPGADWGDMGHAELAIGCSWKHVQLEFSKNGMRAAQEYIEKRVLKGPDSGQTK